MTAEDHHGMDWLAKLRTLELDALVCSGQSGPLPGRGEPVQPASANRLTNTVQPGKVIRPSEMQSGFNGIGDGPCY